MADGTDYPDLEPDGLGDISIERATKILNGDKARPIKWGEEYRRWPIERRLDYAERLAAAMNAATDLIQQDRDRLAEICLRQEQQIKNAENSRSAQDQLLYTELGRANAREQELAGLVVKLQAEIKENAKRIEELEG